MSESRDAVALRVFHILILIILIFNLIPPDLFRGFLDQFVSLAVGLTETTERGRLQSIIQLFDVRVDQAIVSLE